MDDANLPAFGIIEDILVFCTDVFYLVCSVLVTECFSHHFHAYQTREQHREEYFVCKPASLYDTHVLTAYTTSSHPNSMYVPLKYQLAGMT